MRDELKTTVKHAASWISASALLSLSVRAQDAGQAADLKKQVGELERRLETERAEREASDQALLAELARKSEGATTSTAGEAWYRRFTFGGYGELAFEHTSGEGEHADATRFVGYVGYRFADWIQFHSEVEIEHALVAPDGDGELSLEQAHFDFAISDSFGVRAGRFLTPLGIINETHEPTTFNGVSRPLFDTVVIPTTWVADGVGIFGRPRDDLKYELYVQSSLDGSGFDPIEGLREGRQEGSPGFSHPGASGRIDWFAPVGGSQSLRVGLSSFLGGLDNGPDGVNPGTDAKIAVYSADFQYSIGRVDVRGAYAFEHIDDAQNLSAGVASEIDGWMLELAYHVLPEAWKSGKLEHSDAIVFARYDDADTQHEMPSGVAADPRGAQNEITLGLGFFPVENLVIKADYQIRDDDSAAGLPERLNFGLGWRF